jgi:hypothetical protein
MQVNHDLIAAGHPRLNFELSSFLERMPKHWNSFKTDAARKQKEGYERTPARTWAVGQLQTLQSAIVLLKSRAKDPEEGKPSPPWPEFTEYGCFSCHHALRDLGTVYGEPHLRSGSLAWNTWMVPTVLGIAETDRTQLLTPLTECERVMGRVGPPLDEVRKFADSSREELEKWLAEIESAPDETSRKLLNGYIQRLATNPEAMNRAVANWDAAAQTTLALGAAIRQRFDELEASLTSDVPDQGFDKEAGSSLLALEKERARILDLLRFPDGRDSPGADREPSVKDSIGLRAKLEALIQQAAELLKSDEPKPQPDAKETL